MTTLKYDVVVNLTNKNGRTIIPGKSQFIPTNTPPPWVQIKPFVTLLRSF